MKACLTILMLVGIGSAVSAVEIRPRVVGPPHVCRRGCCEQPGNWCRQWAVYHPAKLSPVAQPEVQLPPSWVVKRKKHCCEQARYDTFDVVEPDRTAFSATFDRYRVRADSPRIPPVFSAYWPNREVPAWFIERDYFYFVRIDPAAPEQQCAWWISVDGQQWDLLEAGALVDDAQRRDAIGGPPELPLPWEIDRLSRCTARRSTATHRPLPARP
jgi:hypothetical protein